MNCCRILIQKLICSNFILGRYFSTYLLSTSSIASLLWNVFCSLITAFSWFFFWHCIFSYILLFFIVWYLYCVLLVFYILYQSGDKNWNRLTAVLNFCVFQLTLKRIQTPHSLFWDFCADKTVTTRWSGCRVQLGKFESKFEPLPVIWQSLLNVKKALMLFQIRAAWQWQVTFFCKIFTPRLFFNSNIMNFVNFF